MENNSLKNTRIEFHILQSFPVTCLNRDDVGAPKTANIGGVTRARVSSQCWKRQVRLALRDLGAKAGTRTKKVKELLVPACKAQGADHQAAEAFADRLAEILTKDTLLFIGDNEVEALARYGNSIDFDTSGVKEKTLWKEAKKVLDQDRSLKHLNALDIALFGRMVAKLPDMNVEAASSFAHAISTHKVANEVEFFTALDDYADPDEEAEHESGSAHMGSLEFNSATYYRYVSLDLGQLAEQIPADNLADAVESFVKALFIAVPGARQTTMSGASPWDYARVLVRKGQRLQVPFDRPVQAQGQGYLEPSLRELDGFIDSREKMLGSLYGKLGDYRWGDREDFSIDDLVGALKGHVEDAAPVEEA
ncbi:type I-E CRISPR-associated protein Cas7/Cse4/CasC [Guyparkeria hydrothermalis]|uniref:type I-E CRISPR-associated protein Cas7/Cse4/CasC n=1 Tax=Guyparkeria hydrothermalis TaxID=923 RepID=UPI0020203549|nr:type I-E CRISPR-associated protein Cas7/Cse4/CasC [Guyparkeria hydrothermalis]MCL7750263.1 type I-E CRISPR-associated protein Cas7/Cse4/CasC [Guyparkeria hydrothermalis]